MDREEFAQLLEACRSYLLYIANHAIEPELRPKGAPSDIVQSTFLIAWNCRAKFHGDSAEELQAWLRAILRWQIARHRRRYRAAARFLHCELPIEELPDGHELPAPVKTASEEMQRREQTEKLARLVERLPKQQRTILAGRINGSTFDEIGSRLGLSSDAVRMCWKRIGLRLRFQLAGCPDRTS